MVSPGNPGPGISDFSNLKTQTLTVAQKTCLSKKQISLYIYIEICIETIIKNPIIYIYVYMYICIYVYMYICIETIIKNPKTLGLSGER